MSWSKGLVLVGSLMVGAGALAALPNVVEGRAVPSLAPMLEQVTPGVVNISTTAFVREQENPLLSDPFFRRFFNLPPRQQQRRRSAQSLGSGVIVDAKQGYVLTNNHVIAKADEITVTLRDGRSFKATLIGADPEVDLAVVQIPADDLTAVALSESDTLRVGDFVVAIGNPFGLGQTVTSGIVSALGRSGLGIEGFEDFIQTDASINPGNSGGALVDLNGNLVGINTAILGPSGGNVGIGFAIPVDMARRVMAQLVEYGDVQRGYFGLSVQNLDPDLARAFGLEDASGAVVTAVADGSPAAAAGLAIGDVVVEVNGRPVRDGAMLRNEFGLLRVGSQIDLTVIRDKKRLHLTATVTPAKPQALQLGKLKPALDGAQAGELNPDHPLAGRVKGVQIVEVAPGSAAWNAGLRSDDVIISVDRKPVDSLGAVATAFKASKGSLLLNVLRGSGAFFLVIR